MKKKGFTLAEVLIAIAIVGVVSTIIVPQFITNTHNQANASKLSTVASDLGNALGAMMLNENVGDIFETSFGRAYPDTTVSANDTGNTLGRYMKVAQAARSVSDLGYSENNGSDSSSYSLSVMHNISNVTVNEQVFNFKFGIKTASSANIFFTEPETIEKTGERVSRVFIDVNGSAAPNKFGRDVFAYVLTEDGHLLPYGAESTAQTLGLSTTDDANTWKDKENATMSCTGDSYDGLGCTARLIENNYKVDY